MIVMWPFLPDSLSGAHLQLLPGGMWVAQLRVISCGRPVLEGSRTRVFATEHQARAALQRWKRQARLDGLLSFGGTVWRLSSLAQRAMGAKKAVRAASSQEAALRKQAKEKAKEEKKVKKAEAKKAKEAKKAEAAVAQAAAKRAKAKVKEATKKRKQAKEHKRRLAMALHAASIQEEELAAARQAAERRQQFWENVMPRWEAHAAAQPQRPNADAFSEWVNRRAHMQGVEDPWADFS